MYYAHPGGMGVLQPHYHRPHPGAMDALPLQYPLAGAMSALHPQYPLPRAQPISQLEFQAYAAQMGYELKPTTGGGGVASSVGSGGAALSVSGGGAVSFQDLQRSLEADDKPLIDPVVNRLVRIAMDNQPSPGQPEHVIFAPALADLLGNYPNYWADGRCRMDRFDGFCKTRGVYEKVITACSLICNVEFAGEIMALTAL
jgi:hypothetical protein